MNLFTRVALLGLLTGLRSVSAPMLVSTLLSRRHPSRLPNGALGLLGLPVVAQILRMMFVGEMGLDKLPVLPKRTAPPLLLGRMGMGAISGAALSAARNESRILGAFVGAAGAFIGAHLGMNLRLALHRILRWPDPVAALVEDTIVAGAGYALLDGAGDL